MIIFVHHDSINGHLNLFWVHTRPPLDTIIISNKKGYFCKISAIYQEKNITDFFLLQKCWFIMAFKVSLTDIEVWLTSSNVSEVSMETFYKKSKGNIIWMWSNISHFNSFHFLNFSSSSFSFSAIYWKDFFVFVMKTDQYYWC